MKPKKINGFEAYGDLPPVAERPRDSHRALGEALTKAGEGVWLAAPVPEGFDPSKYRDNILQAFRSRRTGWKLTTRIDRMNRKVFIARIA